MDDELALHRQLCFALYAASRSATRLYRPVLDELGLTYPQYLVLLVLWERGPMGVKELGTALRLDSGTLSPLLKRLEAAGVVTRGRRADDERSVLVRPTAHGLALRERARGIPRRLLGAGGLPLDEVVALRDTLTRLTAALDAAEPTQASPPAASNAASDPPAACDAASDPPAACDAASDPPAACDAASDQQGVAR